jgi:hypothetical protein
MPSPDQNDEEVPARRVWRRQSSPTGWAVAPAGARAGVHAEVVSNLPSEFELFGKDVRARLLRQTSIGLTAG